jgi:hypothetical protein
VQSRQRQKCRAIARIASPTTLASAFSGNRPVYVSININGCGGSGGGGVRFGGLASSIADIVNPRKRAGFEKFAIHPTLGDDGSVGGGGFRFTGTVREPTQPPRHTEIESFEIRPTVGSGNGGCGDGDVDVVPANFQRRRSRRSRRRQTETVWNGIDIGTELQL